MSCACRSLHGATPLLAGSFYNGRLFQPSIVRPMHVLLVKTSSLGDVIHNLPVVSDLVRAHPGITIDWCVEEAFAEIPRLHPGVSEVIPVALRRWRKAPFAGKTWSDCTYRLCGPQDYNGGSSILTVNPPWPCIPTTCTTSVPC